MCIRDSFNDHQETTESGGDNSANNQSPENCMIRCQNECSVNSSGENDASTTSSGENDASTSSGENNTTTSSSENNATTSSDENDASTASLDIEEGPSKETSDGLSDGPSTETFSNMNNLNSNLNSNSNLNTGRSFWSLDLLLKSVLFACLFYVLAHTKTRATVTKYLVRGKENVSYVLMVCLLYTSDAADE